MSDFREKTRRTFRSVGIKIVRYRLAVLFLTVLFVGTLSCYLPKLNVATTLESSFKEHNAVLQDYQRFRDMFGRDDAFVLLIKSEDIFNPQFLVRFKQFHQDLENSVPLLSEVKSLINARYIEAKDGKLSISPLIEELPQTSEQAEALREKAINYPLYKNTYLSKNADFMIVEIRLRQYHHSLKMGNG